MIDIHSHILPGLDDGPGTIEESIAIISAHAKLGTEIIVATPHNMPGMYEVSIEKIRETFDTVCKILKEKKVSIKLLLGHEITYRGGLIAQLDNKELLTINDNAYFLFEFPSYHVPPEAREFVFQASLKGHLPVIAHPERNIQLRDNLDKLEQLVAGGALVQITAGSLLGRLGSRVRKDSRRMLKRGLVHVIASDCHSEEFGPGDLKLAYKEAARIVGKSDALKLVKDNPMSIIEGRPLSD